MNNIKGLAELLDNVCEVLTGEQGSDEHSCVFFPAL